jgi:predicted N-formylglutamate amidohydrolase
VTPELPPSLLAPGDPPAVEAWWPTTAALPVLLACDHASARIPSALGGLGLPPAQLERHIAVDIGAAELTRRMAARLGVPAVLSGYSRLVVDCNRHLEDPSAFPDSSDGVAIPGNADLGPAVRASRVEALYRPYHVAIDRCLARLGPAPALVAVHSFTPALGAAIRPWHVGILWDTDSRLAGPLLAALRADGRWCVGDNEPYSGRHPAGYTIDAHAEARGLPHVSIEVRQDLLSDPDGIDHWAALLASALHPILEAQFGVRTLAGSPGN